MQIDTFMRDNHLKLLTGFRKNHSTQHYMISMLEMWKNTLDKGGYVSATFMDLSKAFDTLNHNLLIAKLGAYGSERDSFSFMKSYVNDTQQKFLQEFCKVQYLDHFYLTSLSITFFFLFQVLL